MVPSIFIWVLVSGNWPIVTTKNESLIQSTSCPDNRFGAPDCKYMCHCAKGTCDNQGQCQGQMCAPDWFGPACQYVDVAVFVQGHEWLNDSDDTTCKSERTVTSITLYLARQVFTFMWLVANDPDSLHKIKFEFDQPGSCLDMLSSNSTRFTLEVHCHLQQPVDQVILRGSGVSSLCSVHVSGGRSVALGQLTPTTPKGRTVDGDISTCLTCNDAVTRWSLTFTHVVNITKYTIISHRGEGKSYRLRMYAEKNVLVYDGNITTTSNYASTTLRYDKHLSIKNVVLQDSGGSCLVICELFLYGDTVCADRRYGWDCEHECHCEGGLCLAASDHCLTNCAENATGLACSYRRYPAKNINDKGNYGLDCLLSCSEYCVNHICDPVNGSCLEGCAGEYLPPFCGTTPRSCGEDCGDSGTGKCSDDPTYCVEKNFVQIYRFEILAVSIIVVILFLVAVCYSVTCGREPRYSFLPTVPSDKLGDHASLTFCMPSVADTTAVSTGTLAKSSADALTSNSGTKSKETVNSQPLSIALTE